MANSSNSAGGGDGVLQNRAEELAASLEIALDAIFVRDARRRITFWNHGASESYGYSADEALGRHPRDLLKTEYPIPLEEIERIVERDGGWEGNLVQYAKDGRRIVVASRWAARYDSGGRLAGLLEVNREIAPRLTMQLALLEAAPDGFVGVDDCGKVVFVNHRAEELFGYSREELLGEPVETLVPADAGPDHRSHRAHYARAPRTREMGVGLELQARHRDGSLFPVEVSLAPIDTPEGRVTVASVRDIAARLAAADERERLLAEAERQRLRSQLQQAQRLESLGQLAGGIAHDFNNLLAIILNYTAFIDEALVSGASPATANGALASPADNGASAPRERPVPDFEEARGDLAQVRSAAERASQLTRQLLAFARREVVQPEVVDVNRTVDDVEQLLRRTIGEQIELRVDLCAGPHAVLIDPGKLEQILINLAVNARDAMPAGGLLRIDTANVDVDEPYAYSRPELHPGPYMRIRVSDTGEGMTAEVLDRAFDPFFTTKPQGQGTGLGLATVYGIVQQAGGYVQVYSEPGVGTTLTMLLPASEEQPGDAVAQTRSPGSGIGRTVLLVEDEPALREVIARVLRGAGYNVIEASNGEEALEVAGLAAVDLLVSDVVMPRMSGPALVDCLQADTPALRVLLMSGFAQPVLDAGEMAHRELALIEKPFTGAALLSRVEEVLAG